MSFEGQELAAHYASEQISAIVPLTPTSKTRVYAVRGIYGATWKSDHQPDFESQNFERSEAICPFLAKPLDVRAIPCEQCLTG